MSDEREIRRRRAAYRASHRGTKEMDFILGRFAGSKLSAMSSGELDAFERLLAMPDPVLAEWFSHGADPGEPAIAALIAAMRSFHGLAAAEE
jgi:antitoxin CptB